MIHFFRSSKCIILAGYIVAVALSAVVFLFRSTTALWMNLITVVLVFALAVIVSRLVANMVATNTNAKLLGILHVDLEPERFVALYRDIPAKAPEASYLHTVTSSYLAAGYAAMGDYDKAQATLFEGFAPSNNEKHNLAVRTLIHDNRCEYALLAHDGVKAEKELAALREVLQKAAVLNPDLSRNYRPIVFFYEQWQKLLSGETVDEKQLSSNLAHTPVKLRRLEMQMVMADSYAMQKQNGLAKELYQTIVQEGGRTHFVPEAQTKLDALLVRMKA